MTAPPTTAAATSICDTPLGPLRLEGGAGGLRRIRFLARTGAGAAGADVAPSGALGGAAAQLREYFDGRRTAFELPLELGGTPFQRAVWDALLAVPYGETTTYARLAAAVGRPHAVRAVGAAVGRTPVPIVVPCHRALGSDGSLTGYAGGLERKRALLELERAHARAA